MNAHLGLFVCGVCDVRARGRAPCTLHTRMHATERNLLRLQFDRGATNTANEKIWIYEKSRFYSKIIMFAGAHI